MTGLAERVSLRTRLVAIVTGLVLLSLLAVIGAVLAVLRPVLVADLDGRLRSVVENRRVLESLVNDAGRGAMTDNRLPTDYVVQVNDADGGRVFVHGGPMMHTRDLPDLSAVTVDRARAQGGDPYTLDRWRVISRVVQVNTPAGPTDGTVSVALPLSRVAATLQDVTGRVVVLGVAVLLAAVLLGWAAVRTAFRPLREVEAVTAAFADGDMSRRVAPRPTGTEVGRLGAAVNAMLDRIQAHIAEREASEARMRRFVGDAGHELRTPLAAVRGFAELHRQGAVRDPEDVTRTFDRIEQEAVRMGGLVDDLLTLARLDEQRPLRSEPVDLLVLAADAVHDARALAPDRAVTLTGLDGTPAPSPAPTLGDDARLRQVLANLVANAVRHTPAGTPVEVGVGVRDGWALWQVTDHGPGVPPEEAERVFERFYRTDSSRTRGAGGGSGLGLAIVAALVRAHGGAARVVPTPGGGATFEVALPTPQ
ncbi:MAG: ATP-binding protein [Actinomycetes bacterium]